MSIESIVKFLNDIAWGPWMLLLLVGTGVDYYSPSETKASSSPSSATP